MGFWGNIKKTANFYESAKTIICHVTGLDRKSAHEYISDHDDLFKPLIDRDVPVHDGLLLVSNYLLSKLISGESHKSQLLRKYEVGLPRKYDMAIVAYQILNQDRETFSEVLNAFDERIALAKNLFDQRTDIAEKLGIDPKAL